MDIFAELMERLAGRCPGLELREHEPMAKHTSFRVGGPVRLMALPRTAEEAVRVVQAAAELGIKPFFMGNGSNLLVADGGWEGLIVKTFDGLSALEGEGDTLRAGSGLLLKTGGMDQVREVNRRLRAESGIPLSRLAVAALDRGLTGLEFAHGIPGSLGGGVTMNAGAYGGELCQVITAVTCLTPEGEVETVPAAACAFGYRCSAFSGGERLILGAELRLTPGDPAEIRAQMEELARRRKEKQPLEYPSAGSTFKRPEGYFAAALIDSCGLKGYSVGGAQVSEKHAGFLINRGGATCGDLLRLIDHVRETVLRETGVALELEVKTLGVG